MEAGERLGRAAAGDDEAVTQKKETISHWISTINEAGRGLTMWEEDFMESVTEQFDERGSVSDKQEEIIERIYADKT